MKNICLLFIVILVLKFTSFAQEGWFWQHPLPQGNDLRDVFVMDENTIFTVGDRGTLLRSDNAGADWEIIHRLADISENIVDIEFISEQKGFLLANKYLLDGNFIYSSSKILYTENSGMNWKVIAEFDSLRLNDLFFIDENIGWAIGYKGGAAGTLTGMVFKTNDGGHSWGKIFSQNVIDQPRQDDKAISFSTIQFIDSKNGWAAGKSSSWGNTGELLNTTDGGFNWSVVNDSLNVISSFEFLNQKDAWIIEYSVYCGWGWYWYYSIKKTTDGGYNWEDVFSGYSNHSSTFSLPSIYFIDSNTGWVKEGNIHKTTDGGLSWSSNSLHTPWNGALHFSDEQHGCIVGKNGEILSTQDGGQSWIERSTMITDCHLLAVHFYDENIGWATGWGYTPYPWEGGWNHGRLFGTSDGGSSWVEQLYISGGMKYDGTIRDVQAITDQIAYAVGHLVFKTTNGGINWNTTNNPGDHPYSTLFFLNADTGFVVADGMITKTTNGGMDWNNVLSSASIESIFFINNCVGWAVGPYIHKTTDEGDTWQEIGVNNFGMKSICFTNTDIGWAVGKNTSGDGVIIRSIDGGFNWDVIHNLNGYEFRSLCFIDSSRGFVVGLDNSYLLDNHNYNPSGIILSIDDASENFSVKQESWTKGLNDIFFLNDDMGWAVGYGSTIIKTNGGATFVEEKEVDEIPADYNLSQNYPNSFNPSTKIKYSVPITSKVLIRIFDMLGNEIETLVNEVKQTGTYEITWYAENLTSGIYFYQLNAGSFVETKKMVFLK